MENSSVSSTTPVYTLSIASSLSGTSVHSIRQYINKGLMIPFKKESNRNLFSQVDILRLKFIHKLLDEDGLNIAGIRTYSLLFPAGQSVNALWGSVKLARLIKVILIPAGKHLKRELSVRILTAGNVMFIVLLKTTLI